MATVQSNTIGAALAKVATPKVKLTDEQRAEAARKRARENLVSICTPAEVKACDAIIKVAQEHAVNATTWAATMLQNVSTMFPGDTGVAFIKSTRNDAIDKLAAIGKDLAILAGTSWARTAFNSACKVYAGIDKLPQKRERSGVKGTSAAKIYAGIRSRSDKLAESLIRLAKVSDRPNAKTLAKFTAAFKAWRAACDELGKSVNESKTA